MPYPTTKQIKELRKIFVHRLWLDNFYRMIQFEKLFNRFPKRHEKYYGHQLGAWCQRQRRNYKDGNMELWRFEMLNTVGFQVELPDPFEENVKIIGQLWKEYPESWPFIPKIYCYDDYDRLQAWAQGNRKRYINGELDKKQIKLLKSINFPLDTQATKWEQDITTFRNFVQTHNRYPKRSKTNLEENKLAEWRLHKMRLLKNGLLPKDKLSALNSIRPDLLKTALKKKNAWDLKYDKLKEIWKIKTELQGKIPVSRSQKDYTMWYNWFNCNKQRFMNGSLPKEKGFLLKRIGFNFSQKGYAQKD
jgi:hypothetical protein